MRALIIDDDESERATLAGAFNLAGFDVAVAANGEDGLELLRTHGADLVILDLVMPVLDGYSFLDAVTSDPELSDVPVMVVSAADYDARLMRSVAYVKKPCRLTDLVERARR